MCAATHPERQDRWALRDLIREAATAAARVFEGEQETYTPIAIRS